MNYILILYLADLAYDISIAATICALAGVVLSIILLMCRIEEQLKTFKPCILSLCITLLMSFTAVVMPSKTVMYSMIALDVSKEALDKPLIQKVISMVEKHIDAELAKD